MTGTFVELPLSVFAKSVHRPLLTLVRDCRFTHGQPSQVTGTLPPDGAPMARSPNRFCTRAEA
jgi:hypothetical protein